MIHGVFRTGQCVDGLERYLLSLNTVTYLYVLRSNRIDIVRGTVRPTRHLPSSKRNPFHAALVEIGSYASCKRTCWSKFGRYLRA